MEKIPNYGSSSVKLLYETKADKPMRVACFMSGSGSNVKKIIEHEQALTEKLYKVILIFSDVADEEKCRAKQIAVYNNIPFVCIDIMQFYINRGHVDKKDLTLRPAYFKEVADAINGYEIDLIALGGFMSIATQPLLDEYDNRIINVHPADLSIIENGKRKYTGAHAVRDAILSGESHIRSSVHIVREMVDYGEILTVSSPLEVKLPNGITLDDLRDPANKELLQKVSDENQDRLKEKGDWVIFPRTIDMIASGRFGSDGTGNVYLDGKLLDKPYLVED